MAYLFSQLFFWLLAAFGLGLAIGWWMRARLGVATEKVIHEHKAELAQKVAEQKDVIPDRWAPHDLYDGEIDNPDDLKRINGVTSKLEVLLNTIGIYKLEQIANLNRNNISWITDKLGLDDRIEREEWVSQAKLILAKRSS